MRAFVLCIFLCLDSTLSTVQVSSSSHTVEQTFAESEFLQINSQGDQSRSTSDLAAFAIGMLAAEVIARNCPFFQSIYCFFRHFPPHNAITRVLTLTHPVHAFVFSFYCDSSFLVGRMLDHIGRLFFLSYLSSAW
jgi:hypothetical protein